MSTIQELWFGNIKPNEDKVITDEEKRLVELMARHQEQLFSSLRTNELDSFYKYVECSVEYASLLQILLQQFTIASSLHKKQASSLIELACFPFSILV